MSSPTNVTLRPTSSHHEFFAKLYGSFETESNAKDETKDEDEDSNDNISVVDVEPKDIEVPRLDLVSPKIFVQGL